jgi:hypothetical protein
MITIASRVVALLLFAATTSAAELTSRELLDALGDKIDRQALARGEIVWTGLADQETKRELKAVMMVEVPARLADVVQAMQKDPALKMGLSLPIEKRADWQAVQAVIKSRLTDEERKLVHDKDAADNFNVSAAELAQLRKAGDSTDAGTAAWIAVLQNRVKAYKAGGATALPAYVRADGAKVSPGGQLIAQNQAMDRLQERYPDFFDSLVHYPKIKPGLAQQHSIAIDEENGRPLFMLKHQLVQIGPQHTLIAERQYYLNHSLDALQVVILFLPTEKGTLVSMLNQTYTGKVAGFGTAIAHKVGRSKVHEKILPLFEGLQKRFPR